MPNCPHCGKFTSFHDYGIDNVLEGEEAEQFWENEKKPVTSEQIKFVMDAIELYRKHPIKW